MLELPIVVGLEEDSADEADDRLFIWEDADDIGPPLALFVEAFQVVGGVQFGSVLAGEGHVGEHVGFTVDDEIGEPG